MHAAYSALLFQVAKRVRVPTVVIISVIITHIICIEIHVDSSQLYITVYFGGSVIKKIMQNAYKRPTSRFCLLVIVRTK